MNKLFTSIAAISLGLTMAIGVGAAVGASVNAKEAVEAEATAGDRYERITSASEIVDGASVIIVNQDKNKAMSTKQNNNNRGYVAVTSTNDIITIPQSSTIQELTVYAGGTSGQFGFYTGSGFLFAVNNNNYLRTTTDNTPSSSDVTETSAWTISVSSGVFSITNVSAKKTNSIYIAWNSQNSIFSGYGTGQQKPYVYKKIGSTETYTVSFNGNGGTGSMADVEDVYGSYKLPSNGFTAPNGQAFAGWKAENAGSLIAAGGSYTVESDVTFYAQWAAQRTLTYNANGGSGTMTDPNSPYGDGATVTVLANGFTAPSGKRFVHWNTSSDGTGTSYNPTDTFSIGANTTLYAIWEDTPPEVVIDKDNIVNFSTTYAERTWSYGSGSNAITGKTYSYKNGDYIQLQKTSKSTCYFYNIDAIPGPITKIELTVVNSSATTAMFGYFGKTSITSKPSSGEDSKTAANSKWTWTLNEEDELTYFYICNGADDTKYVGSVTITYKKVTTVDPTGITLSDSSAISMDTYGYGNRTLFATVEPFNANDKTVTWGTSDSSVVTVTDGVLTAKGTGNATVYATTANFISDVQTPELKVSVSVHVYQAEYLKATFVPTSTTAANQADDYLPTGSVSLSSETAGQWHTDKSAIQLTSGKDSTFTISGYAGMKITGIDLVMSSNGNAGTGALTVTAGSTTIHEISTAPFSDASWNGAFDANPCYLYKDTTDYVVGESETIVFSFSAAANSLYIHSVSIRYLDYSLEQWCENFLTTLKGGENPICIAFGETDTDDLKDAWLDLGLAFLDLSEDLQELAAEIDPIENGTTMEQAMYLYDWCVSHYSADICDRFISGRGANSLTPTRSVIDTTSENIIPIIVIVSLISVSAIGGYFFIRRRKEHN